MTAHSKYAHHGDPELLEEFPGEVETEAEKLFEAAKRMFHDRTKEDFWQLNEWSKGAWKAVARRNIVQKRPQ